MQEAHDGKNHDNPCADAFGDSCFGIERCLNNRTSSSDLRSIAMSPHSSVLAAFDDMGQWLGSAVLQWARNSTPATEASAHRPNEKRAIYISSLCVKPWARGQGVATKLMDHAESAGGGAVYVCIRKETGAKTEAIAAHARRRHADLHRWYTSRQYAVQDEHITHPSLTLMRKGVV
jgi:predicted GNAT family acetyltransferase